MKVLILVEWLCLRRVLVRLLCLLSAFLSYKQSQAAVV
jgi:hypothetical protein